MSACDLIKLVRALEADHGPGGWPAVEMATISALADEIERLQASRDRLIVQLNKNNPLLDEAANKIDALVAECSTKADQILKLMVEIEAFGTALLKAESEIERLRSAAETARAALSDLLATRDPVVYSDALAALDAALGPNVE